MLEPKRSVMESSVSLVAGLTENLSVPPYSMVTDPPV